MKHKKFFAAVALGAAFCLAFAGCGSSNGGSAEKLGFNETGMPIVNEKTTLNVLAVIGDAGKASSDSVVKQKMEEVTNIHAQYEDITESAWKEKKGLKMSSKDLPDVMIGMNLFTDADLLTYAAQGLIQPLDELIEKYAPNVKHVLDQDPELKKQITASDGHIYAIPCYDNGFVPETSKVLYINKAWLDKLGLDVPADYDELYNVLKAFKERDPNGNGKADEIPFSFSKDEYPSELFLSFGSQDLTNINDLDAHIEVKDGKVLFSAVQPEYQEAIRYFNKLFSEGLVDQEAFTQDSATFNAKTKAYPERQVGLFLSWRSTTWKNPAQTEDDYVAISPMKGPNGLQLWPTYPKGLFNRGSFVITSACENPEIAMRWADNYVSEENSIQLNLQYQLGEHVKKTEDGKYEILKSFNKDTDANVKNNGEVWLMTPEIVDKFVNVPSHMQEKFELDKVYADYHEEVSMKYPDVFFTQEEIERLGDLRADIIPYVNGKYASWMMQGGMDAEWDAYLKKLQDMKLDEMLKIYQSAYDRYMSLS